MSHFFSKIRHIEETILARSNRAIETHFKHQVEQKILILLQSEHPTVFSKLLGFRQTKLC